LDTIWLRSLSFIQTEGLPKYRTTFSYQIDAPTNRLTISYPRLRRRLECGTHLSRSVSFRFLTPTQNYQYCKRNGQAKYNYILQNTRNDLILHDRLANIPKTRHRTTDNPSYSLLFLEQMSLYMNKENRSEYQKLCNPLIRIYMLGLLMYIFIQEWFMDIIQ